MLAHRFGRRVGRRRRARPRHGRARARIRLRARGLLRGTVTGPGGARSWAAMSRRSGASPAAGCRTVLATRRERELRAPRRGRSHLPRLRPPSEAGGLAHECWNDAPSLPSSTPSDASRRAAPGRDRSRLDPAGRISGLISGYPTGTQGSVAISAFRNDGGEWYPVGSTVVEPFTSPNPFELGALSAGTYRVASPRRTSSSSLVFADECVGGPRPRRPGPTSRWSRARRRRERTSRSTRRARSAAGSTAPRPRSLFSC